MEILLVVLAVLAFLGFLAVRSGSGNGESSGTPKSSKNATAGMSASQKERWQRERQFARYEEWDRKRRAEGHTDSDRPGSGKAGERSDRPTVGGVPPSGFHGGYAKTDDVFRVRAMGSTKWVALSRADTRQFSVLGTEHFEEQVRRLGRSKAVTVGLKFSPNDANPTAVVVSVAGAQIGWLSGTWHEPSSPYVRFVRKFEKVAGMPLLDGWVEPDGWVRVQMPKETVLRVVLTQFDG